MGKGFRKFKRKFWVGTLARAAALSLSAGALVASALWLADKLTATQPRLFIYVGISAAAALLGFLAVLVTLLPTDKRVAKRLDRTLSLGERVQTMIAFRDDQGDMAVLQREDTDRILSEIPKGRVKGTCTWLFVLLPLLACLCTVGTLIVPAKEPPTPPPAVDNNFSITPWQEQALKDLIEEVRASGMEEEPKEGVVKQLESLLIKLKSTKKESVMKETVISTIESIHKIVSEHNTYDVIAASMASSPAPSVRKLGTAIDSLEALLIGEWMNTTQEALQAAPAEQASTLSAGITQALTLSRVDPSNEVHLALIALALRLAEVTDGTPKEEIDTLFGEAEEMLSAALRIQSVNEEVENDTIYTLLSIFGIKATEVPEHVFNDPDDPRGEGDYDPGDDMDKIHAGGLGSAEMIFGSDDTVYDPDSGTYVTYGEVINGYFARITEMLVDGSLTPELEKMLSDYYAYLFNGTENKESNGN